MTAITTGRSNKYLGSLKSRDQRSPWLRFPFTYYPQAGCFKRWALWGPALGLHVVCPLVPFWDAEQCLGHGSCQVVFLHRERESTKPMPNRSGTAGAGLSSGFHPHSLIPDTPRWAASYSLMQLYSADSKTYADVCCSFQWVLWGLTHRLTDWQAVRLWQWALKKYEHLGEI